MTKKRLQRAIGKQAILVSLECRYYSDCLPVETMTGFFGAVEGQLQLVVKSKRGTAVVPSGLSVQQSKDSRMHICMQYDSFGAMEATCLFLPPGT